MANRRTSEVAARSLQAARAEGEQGTMLASRMLHMRPGIWVRG
jgi:hypothetical protein